MHPVFDMIGPQGSYRIQFRLDLPTTEIAGRLEADVCPLDMSIARVRLRVGIPPADAPPKGIFHLTFFDQDVIGISLVSTVDDLEVHATVPRDEEFSHRVMWLLAVALA